VKRTLLSSVLCIALILAPGCASSPAPTPVSEQALAATVNAAVQATAQAQSSTSATIDAAVKATNAAAKPAATPTPVAQATAPATATTAPAAAPVAQPTPIPPEQYATMTEEEIAALIDQAVAEAVAATSSTSSSTTTATSDDALTQAEIDALIAVTNEALALIEAANAAIGAYYDLYGDLAVETVAALQAIEQELSAMNDSLIVIAESLTAMNAALQQGLILAQDTIDQLEAAAQTAKTNIAGVQTQAQSWLQSVQADLNKRAQTVLDIQPDNIATNRQGALQNLAAYVDTVHGALEDAKISADELAAIALNGANASASLKAVGGTELKGLSDSINSLTTQLARGQMPQAKASFTALQGSIPSLPSIPKLPKPSK
jgi:hypothetical protein